MQIIVSFSERTSIVEWNGLRLDDFASRSGWMPEHIARQIRPGDLILLEGEKNARTVLRAAVNCDSLQLGLA